MRLGVIDCGTNTFHILVVETKPDGTFETLFKFREYVRLGQEGLDFIGKVPFKRGIASLQSFRKKLDELEVERFSAFGTEALRRATNGEEFIKAAKAFTGIPIQLISGDEEARLIHLGVMQAVPPFDGKGLIMDIGGGSVEFIIAGLQEVFWAQSFPVGVQVLYSEFHKNDPITQSDILAMEAKLHQVLQPLLLALENHETPLLMGASGSFEVVEDMLVEQKPHPLYSIVPAEDYYQVHERMIATTLSERFQTPKLPPERAELIVVAFLLIDFVIRKAGVRRIVTSAYAMKEGILLQMLRRMKYEE